MTEPSFPYPIIFGALDRSKPFPHLNLKTEHGVQKVFSRTNYNLFLDDPEERANLSVGQFIKHLRQLSGGCAQCIKPWGCCRIFIDRIEPSKVVDINGVRRRISHWVKAQAPFPNWDACGMYRMWLSQTQTPAERRFLERYLSWVGQTEDAWQWSNFFVSEWNTSGRGQLGENGVVTVAGLDDELFTANGLGSNEFPALIPQVWLNYIHDSRLGPADPQREHLHDNPSVVDFIMLHKGEKHIIEIDDPGHYATFDKNQQKYVVSEEEYTKNLRIERRLQWDGWEIHRFSNWEILNSFNAAYVLAILGLKEPSDLDSVGDYLKEDPPEDIAAEELPW